MGCLCAFLFILIFAQAEAHKEPTHQYIIREGYQLLKKHLGKPIPEFELHVLGANGMGREGEFHDRSANPWSYSTVCGGAWSEDHHDPIRYMHEYEYFFKKGMFTSINHFWDPDQSENGFNNTFALHLPWNPWPTGIFETNICALARTYASDFEHDLMAFRKAMIYLSSTEYQPSLQETYFFHHDGNDFPGPGYYGKTLFDWYHGRFTYDNPTVEEKKKDIIYSIIGRIAHLLGDMSIPAHVKCDEHGLWHDPYEDAMNYVEWSGNKESPCIDMNKNIPASKNRVEYWNHERIFSEKGSVVFPSCSLLTENPYWTLFYTTAQIADYFASNRFAGDDEYLEIGELPSIIGNAREQGIGPRLTHFVDGHPRLSGYSNTEDDLNAIRDMTFPYVIRATAGLLYQVALEFQLINAEELICPSALTLQHAVLEGPRYQFEAKDIITIGDEKQPFIITEHVQNTVFKAGSSIHVKGGFHAKDASNVHALIGPCEQCHDDPIDASLMISQIERVQSSNLEYTVLTIEKEEHDETEHVGCCNSNGITSIALSNQMGYMQKTLQDKHGIFDATDIHRIIEEQSSGIYEINIAYQNGMKEKRIIARL
jgi:hypothetical protein